MQPRCVQTAEIAWKVFPSRKTKSLSSGRNFIPSGKSVGAPSFTVVDQVEPTFCIGLALQRGFIPPRLSSSR